MAVNSRSSIDFANWNGVLRKIKSKQKTSVLGLMYIGGIP